MRLYYHFKPYLPYRLRLAIRRIHARRLRDRNQGVWPLLPGSERPPEGWPGWPDGRQFAVVLTHDVEGPSGLAKIPALAELELKRGFRSSYNLIPEADYRAPAELRQWLTERGFEVGVHDLYHNGKLYSGPRQFTRHAQRINGYLKDWGAVGFRSGFMHHRLDWLHQLDIQYDSSTFDTDPFEPQPDGVGTIFPFWVPNPACPTGSPLPAPRSHLPSPNSHLPSPISRPGYIELPYTLAQDSTLFLLFGEQTIDLWKQKIDWVARHGGMVLVNVHPDYVAMNGEAPSWKAYALTHYEALLDYLQQRYAGAYWQALPREVAAWVERAKPTRRTPPRRVCMLSYSYYESDNRVMRYAEALAARGDSVDVIALKKSPSLPQRETINGVRVYRIQDRLKKNERFLLDYLIRMTRFWLSSSWHLMAEHRRQSYDLAHIHNIPDFLVFAAWYPKWRGARVILDIHDIVPEFFTSKFGRSSPSRLARWLERMERVSARFADHVIISNHLWLDKYTARSAPRSKCSVFINYVDSAVFRPRTSGQSNGKPVVIFPGGLQWHQGVDIAIRAFHRFAQRHAQAEFHIYGEGHMKPALVDLSRELGLEDRVKFFDPVGIRQVADIMARADLAVVPKRADSFGNEAYSTKIMEFMSLGVPVVVSRTRVDSFYFNDSQVLFFASGNEQELAEAMHRVTVNDALRANLIRNGLDYATAHSWETRKKDYLALVDQLIAG